MGINKLTVEEYHTIEEVLDGNDKYRTMEDSTVVMRATNDIQVKLTAIMMNQSRVYPEATKDSAARHNSFNKANLLNIAAIAIQTVRNISLSEAGIKPCPNTMNK